MTERAESTGEDFTYRWRSDDGHYGCYWVIQLEDDGFTIEFSDECGNDYQSIDAKGARLLTAWLIERGFGPEPAKEFACPNLNS